MGKPLYRMTVDELLKGADDCARRSYEDMSEYETCRNEHYAELNRREAERIQVTKERDELRADLLYHQRLIIRLEKAIYKHLTGQDAREDFKTILKDVEARLAAQDG